MRYQPTRSSSATNVLHIDGVEYVPVTDLQRRCGLVAVWAKKDEHLLLKSDRWQVELAVDSRESEINGHRLLLGVPCRLTRRVFYISRIDAERIIGPILLPGNQQSSVPSLRVIAIDPGHGGVDNGTSNRKLGLLEKTLALDVAARLGKILRAEGYRVVFTRETDTKVELPIRAATANTAGADLFLSIHFNSLSPDSKTSGMELFTFAPTGIRATDNWGAKVSEVETEPSPGNRFDHWNAVLAYAIQHEALTTLKIFDRGKKLAHWGVLRPLNCPGVLIEPGFLSNESEARKIATPAYRQQIAEAIASGVRSYAATLEALRKNRAAATTR
jgi:N-acetylmuramoyl-L-alanine amidase